MDNESYVDFAEILDQQALLEVFGRAGITAARGPFREVTIPGSRLDIMYSVPNAPVSMSTPLGSTYYPVIEVAVQLSAQGKIMVIKEPVIMAGPFMLDDERMLFRNGIPRSVFFDNPFDKTGLMVTGGAFVVVGRDGPVIIVCPVVDAAHYMRFSEAQIGY